MQHGAAAPGSDAPLAAIPEAPALSIAWDPARDPYWLRSREWLVTNGLGGYGSGTIAGGVSRRYHGLFVPNLPSPRGRTMILPYLQEDIHDGSGATSLGDLEYADGRIDGDGTRNLREYRQACQIPTWVFDLGGRRLEKSIVMPHGQNSVYIRYAVTGGALRLHLRPYITFRPHHSLRADAAYAISPLSEGRVEAHLHEAGAPVLKFHPHARAEFTREDQIRSNVLHRVDRDRGGDELDELHSPGYFSVDIRPEEPFLFCISLEPWEVLVSMSRSPFERASQRCDELLRRAGPSQRPEGAAHLVLAADQFLVLPGSRFEEYVVAHASGEEARTVIAGYHWFTDWGRDTMISLEGLALLTGRYDEARWILRTFSHYFKDGLLPNHFPEGERTPLYNAADATWWYIYAIERYHRATGDDDTVRLLYPVLAEAVAHHVKGTHFGIAMDPADGLLRAGEDGHALTWMDAKVHGWVVTPRRGKPVEIQALWYNGLRLMAEWARLLGEPGEPYLAMAERARESFNRRFWHAAGGYLYDVIDGPAGDDASFRPNQIFAISLTFPVLDESRWRRVMDEVTRRLLTPVGLRTLDPGHPDYRLTYAGDLRARDAAYHQGTVWPWLIGHFLDARRKIHSPGEGEAALLSGLRAHLGDAGIGTISEVFDADPPYSPRGCIAQAWSVAEVLRALVHAQ